MHWLNCEKLTCLFLQLLQQLRPTPPHLTSAAAEGLLSSACENESNNAKRMRMGLEPLPVRIRKCVNLFFKARL